MGRFFLIAVVEVDDCAWRDLIRVHQLLYTSFRSSTQVVERGPCIYPERRSSQRSRGAKLLHLSWEMRAGRATRVSRAGLARLISWRMNSARVDCVSSPRAWLKTHTRPERLRLLQKALTCSRINPRVASCCTRVTARAIREQRMYRHQLNRKSAPLHLKGFART